MSKSAKIIRDLCNDAIDAVNAERASAIGRALVESARRPTNDNDWLKPNPDYVSEEGWKTYSDNASGIPDSKSNQ